MPSATTESFILTQVGIMVVLIVCGAVSCIIANDLAPVVRNARSSDAVYFRMLRVVQIFLITLSSVCLLGLITMVLNLLYVSFKYNFQF